MNGDRLDKFIDEFIKALDGLITPTTREVPEIFAAFRGVELAASKAKAALAEEDLGEQLIEGGKQALEYALNVESETNKFSDQPAEEKPHPNAVEWNGDWMLWEGGQLKSWDPGSFSPLFNQVRLQQDPYYADVIARAKAAAGVE